MYDKGYVRLTALRRNVKPFSPTLRIGLNDLAPYLLMVNDFVATVVKRLFFFSAVTQLIKILCKHRAYLSR